MSNEEGLIKYQCFRNSCDASGVSRSSFDINDYRKSFNRTPLDYSLVHLTPSSNWVPVERFDRCWEMLDKYNSTDVFDRCPDKFWYDCADDRLVFVEYDHNYGISLATGRTMCGDHPKWYKYVTHSSIFTATTTTIPIVGAIPTDRMKFFICEDAFSACSLARVGSALALCGTAYNINNIIDLVHCSTWPVYICLDQDATAKALQLKIKLEAFKGLETRVVQLSDDAKYLSLEQLKKELSNVH